MRNLLEVIFIAVIGSLIGCNNKGSSSQLESSSNAMPAIDTTVSLLNGKQLAEIYCQRCHTLPEPGLLSKAIWREKVLPNMALRLGVGDPNVNAYRGMSYQDIYNVTEAKVFANQPLLSHIDWEKIVSYYVEEAPELPLPQRIKPKITVGLPNFTIEIPSFRQGKIPITTLVKFNETTSDLYIGSRNNQLYKLNRAGQILDSLQLDSPPVEVIFLPDGSFRLLTIGIMNPSDEALGKLQQVYPAAPLAQQIVPILSELPRPVHFAVADLNQDGQEDIVICGFGNHTGRLSWYESINHQYKEHILKEVPGARRVHIQDFNRDGRPDIMVLMAQGNEGVSIYYNEGEGQFREKSILQFPPVYGSSDFELVDFNKDGALDILYTNGDNADYSYSLKNYHGIRLFLNDGKENFKEAWFYPMFGAGKATARDFDQDGDLDIVAISFFPDVENTPEEGFVYLENQGQLNFKPYTCKEAAQGNWLTFDTGDIDKDGDQDIILGSFASMQAPAQENKHKTKPNLLVLLNKLNESAQIPKK